MQLKDMSVEDLLKGLAPYIPRMKWNDQGNFAHIDSFQQTIKKGERYLTRRQRCTLKSIYLKYVTGHSNPKSLGRLRRADQRAIGGARKLY